MSSQKPLYELIKENMTDGVLPENFHMPMDGQENLGLAPGTRDGLYVFHSMPEPISDADRSSIKDLVEAASAGDFEKAEKEALMLGSKSKALPVMADVQQYIADHIDTLSSENLFRFACTLMEQSADIESVKLGLGISMLFICQDKEYKDTVRTLGLCEEFTLPAVINMLEWDWPVNEVFALAKKVRGWGRIHAVDRLEPATQMISDWIFHEGINNNIDPGYSVFTCWNASRADKRIKQPLSREDFEAASRMIEALLKDTPAPGLSIMGNASAVLTDFLARAKEQLADAGEQERQADRALVEKIRGFAADEQHKMPEILAACDEYLA